MLRVTAVRFRACSEERIIFTALAGRTIDNDFGRMLTLSLLDNAVYLIFLMYNGAHTVQR